MNPASILIASSSLADAGLAADSLRSEFGHIALSCRAESAVADFERCRPDVLVLAFQELEIGRASCRERVYSSV